MQRPTVKDEDFVGKEAHLRHREEEPAAILCTLTVDDHASASGVKRYPLGREPIVTRSRRRAAHRLQGASLLRDERRRGPVARQVRPDGVPAARARGRGIAGARGRVHGRALPGHRRRRRRPALRSIPRMRGSGREGPGVREAGADDGRPDRPHRRRAGDRDQAPRLRGQPARGVRRRGGGADRRGSTAANPSCSRSAPPRRRSSCATRWRSGSTAAPPRQPAARSGIPRRRRARSSTRSAPTRRHRGPFDLIFFGNESADSGGFQVGLRVAHALGRPCATGLKGVTVEGSSVRCEQEFGGGRDVYELPLPAVVTVLEGLNLPRYPSVPGRMRAGASRSRSRSRSAGVAARALPARRPGRRGAPGRGARPRGRRGARRRRSARVDRGGVVTLVLVEHADGVPSEASLQALALAASLGETGRRAPDRARCRRGCRAVSGRRRARRRARGARRPSRPTPGRRSSSGVVERTGHTAVVAPGTPHATDAMARAAARLGEPLAANVVAVTPGTPLQLTRTRWGGSLLEEARPPCGDGAADGDAARRCRGRARCAGLGRDVRAGALRRRPRRARERPDPAAGGRRLARRREGRRHGRARRRARPRASPRSRSWRRSSVAPSAARAPSRCRAGARTPTRSARRGRRSRRRSTSPVVSPGATQHIAGAKGAKRILAVNTDPEAPIMSVAEYAVIGDLHEVLPAVSAELRRRRGDRRAAG